MIEGVIVRRAHVDSQGRRWQIGQKADAHPDLLTCPWLFDGLKEQEPVVGELGPELFVPKKPRKKG